MLITFINSLHLFLTVTSVTPATLAISFCDFSSPSFSHARYTAAAANPTGSLPPSIPASLALFKISIATLTTVPDNPSACAILGTKSAGSDVDTFIFSSLSSRR